MKSSVVFLLSLGAVSAAFGEAPYQFRERLTTVHRIDARDRALKAAADEYAFPHGAQIVLPDDAPALMRRAAEDFREYLLVSMGVNASVRTASQATKPGLTEAVRVRLGKTGGRGYVVRVGEKGVELVASDDWMSAQAFYRLEDRMNRRRSPFLRRGEEERVPMFSERFTFSGYGDDLFPDAHLNQIAHHGFTGIEVWLQDYDVISQGVRQDVNDLIDRAAKYGLKVIFQPRIHAFVHPDDPKAKEMYEQAYGRLAAYYPKAYGICFYGEVCEFPSKDERSNGGDHRHPTEETKALRAKGRPYPGWYPCRDWADWVKTVKPIVRGHNPDCRFVFSTYNWGKQDAQARADLIASLPKDVTLIPTFEMFERHTKRNGFRSPVADYSLSFPGPGRYFSSEAAQAKELGIELWSNCNSAGLTWDFGNIPYQPAPWQWKKRWDALKEAHRKWNLTGLRENHEYGWSPSFIAEMEKEYLVEGEVNFKACLEEIARRDYGEANVRRVMGAWNFFSHAAADYVPTNENQYGPCRIGPAYPYNFGGEKLQKGWRVPAGFPLEPGAHFTICSFDFVEPYWSKLVPEDEQKEIELFESQVQDYLAGSRSFRAVAASLPPERRGEAVRMAALGEYLMHTCQTVVNLKKGRQAFLKGDKETVREIAKAEYANAKATLKNVEEDSRLGWLCSSGYTGSRAQIEWKLRKMRELYGDLEK